MIAVGSRDVARAEVFIKETGLSAKAYGSYDAVLEDPSVDAVYIPLPTALHEEWTIKAAQHGKHVLCEKPVSSSVESMLRMLDACQKHNVAFMDGLMFMHHNRFAMMAEALKGAHFGTIKRVMSSFHFSGDEAFHSSNIRVSAALEPLGSIGDLAWYNARKSLWAFGWQLPTSVTCTAQAVTAEGVPTDACGTLYFHNGGVAQWDAGFHSSFRQWAEIAGVNAILRVDDFVIPRSPSSASYTVEENPQLLDTATRVTSSVTTVEVRDCCQEANMVKTFESLTRDSTNRIFWMRVSLMTQAVMDALMQSMRADGQRVPVAPLPEEFAQA